jgi:SHOCT-like protein
MPDELETILRLVADGRLSPEEAAPIIDALTRAERAEPHETDDAERAARRANRHASRLDRHLQRAQRRIDRALARAHARVEGVSGGRHLRIQVKERGRQQVNLRIPIGFVDAAIGFVPGLVGDQADRIRDAVRAGEVGPIIDVEDPDGDGVLISVE